MRIVRYCKEITNTRRDSMRSKYVKFGDEEEPTCLIYKEDRKTYYRHAGDWEVGIKEVDGMLYSVSDYKGLDNRPLIPTTEQEWKESNGGYVWIKN